MGKKNIGIYTVTGMIIMLSIVGILCVRGCRTTDDDVAQDTVKVDTMGLMLMSIHKCSKLYTAEYKLHKIITHGDRTMLKGTLLGKEVALPVSIGERKIAIPMFATVKASIDMEQITPEDIDTINGKIEIFLPQPVAEITETHIDHEGIKQHVALLRSNFTDEELQNYEKQGRDAVVQDIKKMHIQEMAKQSAARQLVPIISRLGYREEDITISFRSNEVKILRYNK